MITVCSVTGVDVDGHIEAIANTQKAIPAKTTNVFCFNGRMTLESYSHFIVKKLHEIIKTDHVLLVQADGYGRNPENWEEGFLGWDYVGAPFPNGEVGNGGFSLRSKRFLEACATLPGPDVPEDAYLCQFRRSELESMGMKFAPLEVALRFSFEHPVEGIEWDASKSFGFHGKWHL